MSYKDYKGDALRDFLDTGIYHIEDMTSYVRKWNEQRKKGRLNTKQLPSERIYPVKNKIVRTRLHMI